MAKLLTSFLFVFLCPVLHFGQANELPIHFGQFFNNPQINPAQAGSEGSFELSLGTKQNSGVFSGVKTSYISSSFRFLQKDANFHVIGVHFNNDREGLVIRRNRTSLSYSRHLRLSDNWMLASGVNIGLYDFIIKSNPVTGGANSSSENFGAGLHVYNDVKYFSFSINQLNGGEVQPLEQVIKLLPTYNLRYSQNFLINSSVELMPSSFLRFANMPKKEDQLRGGLGLKFSVKRLVSFGASHETNEGSHFFVGVNDFIKKSSDRGINKDNSLRFEFSYFAPGKRNTRTNINAFELTCQYFIF